MQWNKILTPLCAAALIGTVTPWAAAQNAGDDVLIQMQEAARKGDKQRLSALLPAAAGHPLEPWAAYWELRARLRDASQAEIEAFLQRWQGTYQEDRLRNDWLLLLGQRREWGQLERILPDFRMNDDREVQCYAISIKAIEGEFSANPSQDLVRLWYPQRDGDDGCTHAAGELYDLGKVQALDIWKRARLGAELNRQTAARNAVTIVAPDATAEVRAVWAAPVKFLTQLRNSPKRGNHTRELAVLALTRLAFTNSDSAIQQMHSHWSKELSAEQRNWVWGSIGKAVARKLSEDALDHFAQVSALEDLSDDTLGWMARAALRAGQWKQVLRAIDSMTANEQSGSTWVYWKAKALQAGAGGGADATQQAQQLLQSIASVNGFYEQLAMEDLGQAITTPPEPTPPTAQERARAANDPGLKRALYAIRMGLRSEGVREWNYTTNLHVPGGMNDRELLAAAELACNAQVWDRCINTSERTRSFISWQQRYPMPFREAVVARSKLIGLDPAYVYGLIRQESRFIMDARSHVGASGLMQVMPATAKWTAKKIGMTDFQPHMINERDVNITIGTAYLKLALDDFEGSMAMAAAGYNAGPGRPRNWRNGPVLDAAVWAENVPFTETRDYVKKVLSNTTNYAAFMTGQPQSLKARLGQVGPKVSATAYNRDLP